ncbi:ribosome biogenesis GTPase Der [Caulobacter flavus]|uniref:GTPase Der n=1 Tax=Caulobacter flavus TaxID=1679497 RepID=A0A2N5CUD3_9CAUL|nr:ribosome biogenesis GTPase Der [Caulobacter flavus]AYV47857.1 ribosome biogenesis GTPase Der [Caulobacter flavus]PLR16884.1 ribosome biogenesis GTPase Der [Caulobacter flavus]
MPLKLAIVGRPNVGKSTLFNRLAGKKLALVDDQPGVTRDRRFAHGRLGDLDLELIDTAGFEDVTDESLEARMRAQTELAIDEADVALFVFDAREGLTPLDKIFAEMLRRRNKPVVVAANKSEGKQAEIGAAEAHRLGLGAPIPISGEHGEGMADLYAALLAVTPEELQEEFEDYDDDTKPIKIAIIGRPNAGKSTLVNRLIGEQRLLTGPEAGITRDSISVDWTWDGRKIRLVDTAGLRKKAKVNEKLEKLSTQDTIRSMTFAEVVLLVMDATHPFETQDLQIADLAEREGRCVVFVLAKWDLIEDPGQILKEFNEHAERMLPQLRGAPVVALSGETGKGVERLMPAVIKTHRDWSTKVKTRDLNDWLQMAMQRHPPPSVGGKRVKPKYMAQTKARPPTFVLFSSRADQMPDHYRRYLVNSLRESFDLPGVPLRITIKSGANPYAEPEQGHVVRGKRAFEKKEAEKARLKASRNTVKKSAQRAALLAEAAADTAADAPGEAGAPKAATSKAVAVKAGARKAAPVKANAGKVEAPKADPGKAAVKSVKPQGPKAQKKVSTTPSYKVGSKTAGGKAGGPRRPVAGSRVVRGNAPGGRPKGR